MTWALDPVCITSSAARLWIPSLPSWGFIYKCSEPGCTSWLPSLWGWECSQVAVHAGPGTCARCSARGGEMERAEQRQNSSMGNFALFKLLLRTARLWLLFSPLLSLVPCSAVKGCGETGLWRTMLMRNLPWLQNMSVKGMNFRFTRRSQGHLDLRDLVLTSRLMLLQKAGVGGVHCLDGLRWFSELELLFFTFTDFNSELR